MKKIILRTIFLLSFIIILLISYLSIIGIETERFNKQIKDNVKNLNQNFDLDLEKIKIMIDPFRFNINAKTIGPKVKLKDKVLKLETIKSQISIKSLIDNEFSLSNLEVSTKPLEIKDLIFFVRTLKNSPQLYLLEKLVKNGYLVAEIDLEFDENGKIKNNFEIQGIVRDANINFFNKYDLDKLSFSFNLANNNYEFEDIKTSLNKISLSSKKISLKSINDYFLVDTILENENTNLSKENINLLVKPLVSNLDIKKIDFNSENKISFKIDKNFRIDNFKMFTKIKLNELSFLNKLNLKEIFPELKKDIIIKDHLITLNLEKNDLNIDGTGKIFIQNQDDEISYSIKKKKNKYLFNSKLDITNNPFEIIFLNYKKKDKSKIKIEIEGFHILNQKTEIDAVKLKEENNFININNLELDKNLKINNFKSLELSYFDKDKKNNQIKIYKKKKNYIVSGSSFNADKLIDNLINEDTKKNNFFNKNLNFIIKIDQIFLDKRYKLNNLSGKLDLKNNQVFNANLIGYFSKNKRMEFTINTKQDEKVTTLFLDEAEPIVKRYKFIKGYKGGSLDYSSLNFKGKSKSTLKIYDFNLKELPALTKLLTLASLQGIADILTGEGIGFDEFEMNFENQKNLMTINEIYAIGPAISILMNGYVEKDKIISLRGTLVPATTINKVISSIPILGKILVGSKTGEGVFGVSFKIKGPPKNLETTVNPIKTLTPRFITRTLEKIKKN